MRRAEAIDLILRRRASRAGELATLNETVGNLDRALTLLEDARNALDGRVDSDAKAALDRVGVSIADLRRGVATARTNIGRTETRFRRPTLTIGAVGRGGQGKSQFLQSLTGLTDQEIPAGRGGFMTGVPSFVRHGDGPTRAEVELHDESSFLDEVLGPYYAALGLGPLPVSLAAFQNDAFPELRPGSTTRDRAAYDHLRSYRNHLPAYRDHLTGPERLRGIAPEEIRRFVAQHDEHGNVIHDFRAVRRVRITTSFGHGDLGQLTVIDLPGLGDTNLRDEDMLRRAIDGEVDITIFVRRPDPFRDDVQDVDVDLYDIARRAMPELPLDRWAFMLLNRVDAGEGDNTGMLEQLADAMRRSAIRVVDVLAANCTSPTEVMAVFDRVVEHALKVVDELDRSLLDRRRTDVGLLLAEAGRLVVDARTLSARALPTGSWFPRFLKLFDHTHRSLSRALESLVREFEDDATAIDEELTGQLAAALEAARKEIVAPTVREVDDRRDDVGSYGGALAQLVNEIRARMSRQFLPLDDALKARVGAMHNAIADVLLTAGRLDALGPERGHKFLIGLAERLPVQDGELAYGLGFVADFTLNYRGFIQHRVRRALKKLAPDTIRLPAEAGPVEIQYILEELIAETLYDIETELARMAHEPYEAVFAVAEEFRDRVLRAQGAEDEWRALYESLRSEVWSEEFAALAANTALFNRWNRAVEGLATAAGTAV